MRPTDLDQIEARFARIETKMNCIIVLQIITLLMALGIALGYVGQGSFG